MSAEPYSFRVRYGLDQGKVVELRLRSDAPDPEGYVDSPKKLKPAKPSKVAKPE